MTLTPGDNKLPASYNDIFSLLSSPSLNASSVSHSNAAQHTPLLSFEDPFDDPAMEPLPLELLRRPLPTPRIALIPSRSESRAYNTREDFLSCEPWPLELDHLQAPADIPLIQSRSESRAYITSEDFLSCSFMEQELHHQQAPADETNLRINPVGILDGHPVIDLIGSKRSSDAMLSDNGRSDSRTSKRQRIHPAVDSACEMVARFRPYHEKQWQHQFQKLIQYKQEHGSCCVPYSYREDPALARWVKRQRYQYKKLNDGVTTSTMTTRRIQELASIGFVWHSHTSSWQEKLNELKAFQEQTGHCNVPSTYPANVSLSTWVKYQRRQYKLFVSGRAANMTLDRFKVLESMGFVFDLQQEQQRLGRAI